MYNNLANLRNHTAPGRSQSRRLMGNAILKVHKNILETVGNTPLVKLNKIPAEYGLTCEIYAKCEYMNPSGSIKDRIAVSMVADAEKKGNLHPSTTVVEPSSGNTGIGVALNTTLRGNGCIIVTKEKNSDEKVNTITLLGAEVVQLKDSQDEEEVTAKIVALDPKNRMSLGQFQNPVNPTTHYEVTGMEIIAALGDIDMVVMGAGTGGTMTGVGRRVKQESLDCLVVAAEPHGSTVVNRYGKYHPFLVEGIGGKEAPKNLDRSVIDHMEIVTDEESFLMARKLVVKEGLLCGGSSGTAMVAAIKAAKHFNFGPEKRVVVILPDGIRNYMDKFVSNQWMEAYLFMEPPKHTMRWWNHPITNLELTLKYPKIQDTYTCAQALQMMKDLSLAVVVDAKGWLVGMVSKDSLRNYATNPTKFPMLASEDMDFNTPVVTHLVKHCFTLALNGKKGMPTIGRLSRILDITPFVVIGKDCEDRTHLLPEAVIIADDILSYIFKGSQEGIF